jgi:hypothetical protein
MTSLKTTSHRRAYRPNREHVISVRIDTSLFDRINKDAEQHDVTFAEAVRARLKTGFIPELKATEVAA